MDVSDRRMQVQLTQEAKIASDFHFIGAIFAVVGFVSALERLPKRETLLFCPKGYNVFCPYALPPTQKFWKNGLFPPENTKFNIYLMKTLF